MAAETYSLVKDWLVAEEHQAITMKGFAQPIRTFRVRGTIDHALGRDEKVFPREDEGVRISIQRDVADKQKTKAALKSALARIDH